MVTPFAPASADETADSRDARFRSVFENNHTVMLIVDPESRAVLEANPAAAAFYGWSREQLTSMTIDSISTKSHEDLQASLQASLQSPASPQLSRHRLANGSVRDVEIHSGPSQVGDRTLIFALVHDVSVRRSAEEAQSRLVAAMRLQTAALNAAATAMVITDREGSIVWVNAAFCALTGYTAREAIGKNPRDFLKSGLQDETFYADLWRTIVAGEVWRGELTNRRKDGTLYPEMQTITPVKEAGRITHFIAIKRDLTEQRALEAQFLQSQKMEVVGRLAGGIAHDFNNLLTVINATSEMAAAGLHAGDPLRADFEEIGRAGERAAELTRQLLAFSRRQFLDLVALNPGTVIEGMASMLRRLIGEDIELVVTAAPDLESVKADRGQLEQVLLNLAVNARDAMPRGGTLTILGYNTLIGGVRHVQLVVRDTGTGMDACTRARLFEPFFTTKEAGKGTGLGLSTVYGIVKQFGGTIEVQSAVNAGTTFTIALHAVGRAAIQAAARGPGVLTRGVETLLLVEDEGPLGAVASRMLTSAGYTVLACANGEEALALLDTHEGRIDLMITDVVMPGISGRELASRATLRRPGLSVLFTSGHTEDSILGHGILDGLACFIAKPYSRSALTAKVRQVLARAARSAG